MSLMTTMLRKAFQKGDDVRDAGLTTPDDIERWDDICYGTDTKWQMMDVYRPRNATGKLPVIFSIHGGGWTYGDKERYQYYCMSLAQRGFAVLNFTYRPAPEFHFPAAVEDTNLVIKWLLANEECGWFDLEHIYGVGDSAGGHMLALYCAACDNPEYAARLGIEIPVFADGRKFIPNAVGLNCGVYEIDVKNANGMTKGLMKALLKGKCKDETENNLINPLPYITENFPRAYIMTANQDPLAGPPAQAGLVKRLDELGVAYIDKTYGTDEDPRNHVFHLNMRDELGAKCNDMECEFFLSV